MKKKRHTPKEIIKKLREAEGVIAAGKSRCWLRIRAFRIVR
jgi:hypothetical protein